MTKNLCDVCEEEIPGARLQGLKIEPRGSAKALKMLGEKTHYIDLCDRCLTDSVNMLKIAKLII